MTVSSATSTDQLEEHDSGTSNGLLEKDNSVNAVDTRKRPVAADVTSDTLDGPLQRALQAGEWSSPEDPDNPLNWSTAKKAYHAAIPSIYCFTVYVKSSDAAAKWLS